MGNSWSKIATQLPGRTDNDVKNFWHSYTRSRRLQQKQQHVSNDQHGSADNKKCSDQQACSADHEKKQRGHDHNSHPNTCNPGHPYTTNSNIKGLASNCKVLSKNDHNSHPNTCNPGHPYATLHAALSHTNFLINFNDPSHISHHLDTQLLLTQEANNVNPLICSTDLKPIMTNVQSDSDIADAAIYKLGLHSHLLNDQSCRKGSDIGFQHLTPSQEASDDHNTSISALSSSYCEISTIQMTDAADLGRSLTIPSKPLNSPGLLPGDLAAGRFYSAVGLPASYTDNDHAAAVDNKPPEGLQSVIWSFLNRQPAAPAAVSDHYKAQCHHYHHQYHKPNLTSAPLLVVDHLPDQLPSDQNTSSTSSLQYLQAKLADCFS